MDRGHVVICVLVAASISAAVFSWVIFHNDSFGRKNYLLRKMEDKMLTSENVQDVINGDVFGHYRMIMAHYSLRGVPSTLCEVTWRQFDKNHASGIITDDMLFTVDAFMSRDGLKWLGEGTVNVPGYLLESADDQMAWSLNEKLLRLTLCMYVTGLLHKSKVVEATRLKGLPNADSWYKEYARIALYVINNKDNFIASEYIKDEKVEPELWDIAYRFENIFDKIRQRVVLGN